MLGFDALVGTVVSDEDEDGTNVGVFVEAFEEFALAEEDVSGNAAEAEMKLESILCNSVTDLLISSILSYKNFSLSIMLSVFSLNTFRSFCAESQHVLGLVSTAGSVCAFGERPLIALRTSRWIKVSSGVLFTGRGAGVETEVAHGGVFSKASGAAFSRAFLFRSRSRSLQRLLALQQFQQDLSYQL